MTKCKHLRRRGNAKLCDNPPVFELRCSTCPYDPHREFKPTLDYDEEDGLCHLDRTSPQDYEPEPIWFSWE
ncbi:hypothetical protein NIES25_51790 [Nostoc linckia NIES-25]|nr:hypothetical protein NIES25_51510 [Nostoc linckia NIES-25]BAY78703.1 hypothetical protein NIES25_51790 [Nostoc linckia NIES-25]